jgi:hypothetical protein
MPCLVGCIGLMFPRLVLFILWLFTSVPAEVFQGWVWPLLDFLVMPYTTLAYIISHYWLGGMTGGGIIILVIGVLLDIGLLGGTASSTSKQD